MSGWVIAPSGLIEPAPAPEIYCDGIGAIELMGNGNLRFLLIAEQMPIDAGNAIIQRTVVAKIITGAEVVPRAIGQLALCLNPSSCVVPRRSKPHLV
jgi:hypothetical protein